MRLLIKGKEIRFLLLLSFTYAAGSLVGAYFIEHHQGMPPCALCLYQRMALGAIVVCSPFAWLLFRKYPAQAFYLVIPFLYLLNLGISFYHTGVERHIFPAPSQCHGNLGNHSGDINMLRNFLLQKDIIPCDKVSWQLFGLSMATYNMLASSILLLMWGYALQQDLKNKKINRRRRTL